MISTLKHLAYILKIDQKEIIAITDNIDNYYYARKEQKFKKNGTPRLNYNGEPIFRTLYPSTGRLKVIQKRIHVRLLNQLPLPSYMYGARKGKSNIKNARAHQGNKFFFTTDLKKFFPSVSNDMVFQMLRSHKFSPDVSKLLTKLLTYKGQLPQGTPTSAALANLVIAPTLNRIEELINNTSVMTSLIDDLTISSKTDFKQLVPEIIKMLELDGFKISHSKTSYKTRFPEVTGIIVKNNNLDVPYRIKNKQKQIEGKTEAQINGLNLYVLNVKNAKAIK